MKLFILFFNLALAVHPTFAEDTVIKFATLAPEGSTWMNVMQEWNKALIAKSGGKVKFRFYSGGVSGDEKDVVRKIRLGQLNAGGFTGVGLGEIAPSVRILDTPFLFNDTREVDAVLSGFHKEWDDTFSKNGYVLLGWAEVGFVYFFTQEPVTTREDMKRVKMWMWEGDPIAEASFKALGFHPVPLSIADVMTSLQTGLITGVYGSPLGVIALQWFTKTKYMLDFHLADASGAVLISKKLFDKMSKDQQELLLSTGKEYLGKLTELSRKENRAAIETLKKSGVQVVSLPSAAQAEFRENGRAVRRALSGKLYDQAFLDRVEKALQDFRAKPAK